MQIRCAQPEDAKALSEIAFAAKRHWGYPERWIEAWRDVLTIAPEFILEHETHIACDAEETLGFYALVRKPEGLKLEHLWVHPRAMGRGIGRSLFAHAVGKMKALGMRAMEIESDPNASGFYQRMGARHVGVKVTEWEGQPRELPLFVYDLDASAQPVHGENQDQQPTH
jgi:predicted N-acetyltransferase YhbS